LTLRSLHPRGKSPRYQLHRRLGRPQSLSGRCGIEKNLLSLQGIIPSRRSRSPLIYRLGYPGSHFAPLMKYSLTHQHFSFILCNHQYNNHHRIMYWVSSPFHLLSLLQTFFPFMLPKNFRLLPQRLL
jgi:hypothetical protein